jgi:hypothetical protein
MAWKWRPRTSLIAEDGFLNRIAWPVALGVCITLSAYWIGGFYLWPDGSNLFLDAHIYFRATAAWLDGGNPWTTTYQGVPFAGIPPTLLLNLPLLPLGESAAVGFWVAANTLGIAVVIRQLRLPLWSALLLPVVEGWLGAGPDLALAGLLFVGGGWVAALTKPYAAPILLADRRWGQLIAAAFAGVASLLFVPWKLYLESLDTVAASFAAFAGAPMSAAGNPLLGVAVVIALVSLGWRRGLILATPGLLAQQPHYLVFSLEAVRWSRVLALAMTVPIVHSVAVAIVIFAAMRRLGWTSQRERGSPDGPARPEIRS